MDSPVWLSDEEGRPLPPPKHGGTHNLFVGGGRRTYMNENNGAEQILSVSAVNGIVKRILEDSPELNNIRVRGEISNFTHHANGHMYFSLKDANAQIRGVMFQRYAGTLRFKPEDGLEVIVIGSVSAFEKRGEYQFYVRHMQPAGIGALYLQFEKLKKKLQSEGLFDPSRKKPIPGFPRRIAVITSPTGAAVRDVINIITRRFPAVEVIVVPALVQGAEAPASVRSALRRAQEIPDTDTILLVRGGGSIEDLWGFNDEQLARDIAACKIPIVSGIGHETDFTISDFVADLRAPTPSAAAEISVPDLNELRFKLRSTQDRLNRRLLDLARFYRSRVETMSVTLAPSRILDMIDRRRQLLDDYSKDMKKSCVRMIETDRKQILHIEEKLAAIDPRRVLARGFALCTDQKSGRVVRSLAQVKHGAPMRVTLHDGNFLARPDLKTNPNQTGLDLE
jgi:exodeoxyribonuclease VII large subunit